MCKYIELFENRYISAMSRKSAKIEKIIAVIVGEVYPVGQLYCLAGRSLSMITAVLGGTFEAMLVDVRLF